jgi:hypothetical protein
VRKSTRETCSKNVDDSKTSTKTIPSVISTEDAAARKSSVSIMRSVTRTLARTFVLDTAATHHLMICEGARRTAAAAAGRNPALSWTNSEVFI